ncbi:MipA/OmpV family protein [Beijerinckia indica]|uniref:MltA-interacting MipA family protein n=1 Tax=Beijerinckia indica subsp. indica (strain ATCC 9039 / DSM 1715 / NCIMB 8712) TaxID=395963 RepID=B2IBC2_BEII9|nr:MipA/OmpV family protein [Beijerinckia indica]ACB95206.1 MltA-interacting MipA family protein [Beijerinckia indica subsp. indica ATCC 9039]
MAADLTPPKAATPKVTTQEAPESWYVTLGLGPEMVPSFPGSKGFRAVPTAHFGWGKSDPFYAPDDGFDIALLDLGWLRAGPDARLRESRTLGNGNANFYGLHNIDWTFEIGGFTEVWLADFLRTRLELRQGVNGHKGLVGDVMIDYVYRQGPWTFSIGPRMALGNNTFMKAFFSVTPQEAALNGRVYPYNAYGGMTSFGALTSIKYQFNEAWSFNLFGGYQRLMESAAESPIPNRLGSSNQYTVGGIIAYTFDLKQATHAIGLDF